MQQDSIKLLQSTSKWIFKQCCWAQNTKQSRPQSFPFLHGLDDITYEGGRFWNIIIKCHHITRRKPTSEKKPQTKLEIQTWEITHLQVRSQYSTALRFMLIYLLRYVTEHSFPGQRRQSNSIQFTFSAVLWLLNNSAISSARDKRSTS